MSNDPNALLAPASNRRNRCFRIFLCCILWGCVPWACIGGLSQESQGSQGDQPNVLVFLSDDHGQSDSEPYGAIDVRTPNMQRLADRGLVMDRAFIASPACSPSRAALLTGLMPARNGAEANHSYKKESVRSLPDRMREMGYETAAFGKVAHNKADVARHGFDHHAEKHDLATVSSFLKSRTSTKPLCLFVGTHEPHVPWLENRGYDPQQIAVPKTHIDTRETREFRAKYYTDVTDADRRLGEMMDLVDSQWSDRPFVTIYTSDHGAQWPFGKWNLYDAGIRVPMIIAWPGTIPPKSRSSAMVQWIDLLPTLLNIAGDTEMAEGKGRHGVDGKSFLPALLDTKSSHRTEVFTTHSGDGKMNVYPIRSIRTEEWKLIWNLHPEFAHTTHIDKALARDGGRYWNSWFEQAKKDANAAQIVRRYHQRPEFELYHLNEDPNELQNLADDAAHAPLLHQLKTRLEQWMEEQGDKRSVFQTPRLLSDPASTQPGLTSHTDTP